jgi:hypothetical protein
MGATPLTQVLREMGATPLTQVSVEAILEAIAGVEAAGYDALREMGATPLTQVHAGWLLRRRARP